MREMAHQLGRLVIEIRFELYQGFSEKGGPASGIAQKKAEDVRNLQVVGSGPVTD